MKRVVVIGGGLIGLSVARECVRRGHHVTVIERAPERRGASFGNAGMVTPSHFVPLAAPGMVALGLKWMWNPESPFYIRPRLDAGLIGWILRFWQASTADRVGRAAPLLRDLLLASREAFLQFANEEDFGLVSQGLLMLCKFPHTLEKEAALAAQARALGVPAEVLDARQTAALDPGVTMDVAGSVYFEKDSHLRPERYVAALEKRVQAAGVELLFNVEVTGWRRDERRLSTVVTSHGEVAGDEFVLANGAWSAGLVRGLGLRLPMQAGKGYSLTLPHPIELPSRCAILTEARVAVTPMGQSLRFGGTMEIAGMNEAINPRRIAGILKSIPRYYPRFAGEQFAEVQPWSGLRPCSPDGLPYLGRTRAAANLLIATGHAMMGLSLAPVTGELAGQLLDGEAPRFDLTLLAPDRFA